MYKSLKIKVSDVIREKCNNYLKNNSLGNRGFEDGSFEQQLTGLIGEVVVYQYLKGEVPSFEKKENGFDGGFDIEHNGKRIDVKTMGRSSFIKGDYVNNFYVMQQRYNCDTLIFCSFHRQQNIIEICGWIKKDELNTKGIFYKAGTKRVRENGTHFYFRQDNYEVTNNNLYNINVLRMFKNPTLAQCQNRDILPKSNTLTGKPEDWFDNVILDEFGMVGFSFDFFVNWKTNQISPYAWIKKILTVPPSTLIKNGAIEEQTIIENLIQFEGQEYLELFAKFCGKFNLKLQYLLFREVNWDENPETIFLVSISYETELIFKVEVIDIKELAEKIKNYSGGNVSIGRKGLTYGTSLLECYFSKTNSLYPGDVDLIIFDKKNLEVKVLLEYKKHNLNTPIKHQKLSNYYPYPDKRKYDRLSILKDYFKSFPKLICLYYPTKTNDKGRAEIIEGKTGQLVSGRSGYLDLPIKNDLETYKLLAKQVIGIK
jgi:hypothetical protein